MTDRKKNRIAIVGNGPLEDSLRNEINTSDVIIRMNNLDNSRFNDIHYTDILYITNSGSDEDFYKITSNTKFNHICNNKKTKIIHARNANLYKLKGYILSATSSIEGIFYRTRLCPLINRYEVSFLRSLKLDLWLSLLGMRYYEMPSTGIVCIYDTICSFDPKKYEIRIYGFSHHGWYLHPWNAERALIEKLLHAGRIKRGGQS